MEQKLRNMLDEVFNGSTVMNKENMIILEKKMIQQMGVKTPHSFSPKNDSQYITQAKTLTNQEVPSTNEVKSQCFIKNKSYKQVLHDIRVYIKNNPQSMLSALLSEIKQLYESEQYVLTKLALINVMQGCLQYNEGWLQMENGIQNIQEAKCFAHKVKSQLWNAKKLEQLDELCAASVAGLAKGFKYLYFDAKKRFSRQDDWIKQVFINIDEVLLCPCIQVSENDGFTDARNTKTDAVFTTRRSGVNYSNITYDDDASYDILTYCAENNYKQQLPARLRSLCLISNISFRKTLTLSTINCKNLISLSLINCICPKLTGAENIVNLCVFNVAKMDAIAISKMKKLQRCFFYKVNTNQEINTQKIGIYLLNTLKNSRYLQYLQISECPMEDHIKIDHNLPELQYLIIEQCGCKQTELKLNKCNLNSLLYFKVDTPVQLSGNGKLPQILYFNNVEKQQLLKIQYGFKRDGGISDIYETVQDLTVSQYSISTFKSVMEQSALSMIKHEQQNIKQIKADIKQQHSNDKAENSVNDVNDNQKQKCVKWAEIYNEVLTTSVDFESGKSVTERKQEQSYLTKSEKTSQNKYIENQAMYSKNSSITERVKQSVVQNTDMLNVTECNKIRGDNNVIIGRGNKVIGSSNLVLGNNNYVFITKYIDSE